MSFLYINDPKNRDKIVADYFGKRLAPDEDEKVQSKLKKKKEHHNEGLLESRLLKTGGSKRDKYFGIYKQPDGRYEMGDAIVEIRDGDIIVADSRYVGTEGLWNLIIEKIPSNFTDKDLNVYHQLVEHTNVMNHPKNIEPNSRPTATYKWQHIFSKKFAAGNGIQYLPGDIKGLQAKLDYLLGEYRAGNTFATHNQIVAIADELLRRRHLSQEQYYRISSILQEYLK